MKVRLITLFSIVAILMSMVGAVPAQAAAYGTSFVTSITYQNVGTAAATIMIDFYAESSATPISIPMAALNPGASSSVYVGGLSQIASPFKGSAVMNSDQPLVATLVQLPPGASDVKNRPLSNGFSGGAAYVLIPTALKGLANTNTIFSVQNADSVGADLTVNFVPTTGAVIPVTTTNLPAGAAKYFDLGQMSNIPAGFTGSIQIFARKTGTQTDGSVVATAMELSTTGTGAYAFEGASVSSNTVYMPSAFCKFGGAINSAYAVQNTSTTDSASVSVTYSNGNVDGPFTVDAGKKQSLPGCGVSGTLNPSGFIGSATVTSVGAPIVGVAKIGGSGLSTAFLGFTSGFNKVALPYVRWTETHWTDGTRQRANIAIQNVGASELPAGSVTVKYYDKAGALLGTHTINTAIAVGGKANSNPIMLAVPQTEFGYIGGQTGGGAIVEGPAGSQLAVIVRISTYIPGGSTGEDSSGIPVQ
jgi:hypothetical protein